jgi:DNA invertase Pin-like site-specific DNA recombinase
MARVRYSRDVEPSPDSDTELRHILVRLTRGDTLVCSHVTDLSRDWAGLQSILSHFAERGIALVIRHSSRQPDEPVEVWAKRDL